MPYLETRSLISTNYHLIPLCKVFKYNFSVCPGSGILTEESGTIKSPNFPEHYFSGILCDWTITVSFGKRIRLKSRSLNLEQCHPCGSCDHIEISDIDFSSGRHIIGKWCGGRFDIISRSNTVNVRFKSNLNNVGESFVIEYESVREDEGKRIINMMLNNTSAH